MFLDDFDVFRVEPDMESALLGNRNEYGEHLAYIPGEQYAVYFTDGGSVSLDLSNE